MLTFIFFIILLIGFFAVIIIGTLSIMVIIEENRIGDPNSKPE